MWSRGAGRSGCWRRWWGWLSVGEHSAEYRAYIASAKWRRLRADMIKLAENKCQACGAASPRLSVHHITYERLGKERPSDLLVLCSFCHEHADRKRERDVAASAARHHWNARLDGWATKRYGEDWNYYYDESEVEEEFEEWLDRRGDDY